MKQSHERALNCLKSGDLEGAKKAIEEGRIGLLGADPDQHFLHLAVNEALRRRDRAMLDWVLDGFVSSSSSLEYPAQRPYLYGATPWDAFYRYGWAGYTGSGPWRALLDGAGSMSDPGFKACAERLASLPDAPLDLPITIGSHLRGARPLNAAVERGDEALVDLILQSGASLNGRVKMPWKTFEPTVSALMGAFQRGRGKLAEKLLDAGAVSQTIGASALAAAALGKSAKGDYSDAKKAFQLALKCDGLSEALSQSLPMAGGGPLDSLGCLEVWLCRRALDAERLAGAQPAERLSSAGKVKKWLSWAVFESEQSRQEREGAPALPGASVWRALADGSGAEFAQRALSLDAPSRQGALIAAWALSKAGYWRMPLKDGVGDTARDPNAWSCFKALLARLDPQDLERPIKELGGLSLMGAASALGHADVCSALSAAGAGLNPHPLFEAPSPLALAARFNQSRLAMSLLDAGADPLEGALPGVFGYPERGWAIHEALASGEMELFERLLEWDPAQAELKNTRGETVRERAETGAREGGEGSPAWGRALRALRRSRDRAGSVETEAEKTPLSRSKGPR